MTGHAPGIDPPGWYERSTAREPQRQAARETELRQLGRSSPYAAAIAHAEAGQREREREERAASRNPARYYGPGAPETRQTFRQRATDARRQISRGRERFTESMTRNFPGWTPPGTPARNPEPARAAPTRSQPAARQEADCPEPETGADREAEAGQ